MLVFTKERAVELNDISELEIKPSLQDDFYDIVANNFHYVCGSFDYKTVHKVFDEICYAQAMGFGGFSVERFLKSPFYCRLFVKLNNLCFLRKGKIEKMKKTL